MARQPSSPGRRSLGGLQRHGSQPVGRPPRLGMSRHRDLEGTHRRRADGHLYRSAPRRRSTCPPPRRCHRGETSPRSQPRSPHERLCRRTTSSLKLDEFRPWWQPIFDRESGILIPQPFVMARLRTTQNAHTGMRAGTRSSELPNGTSGAHRGLAVKHRQESAGTSGGMCRRSRSRWRGVRLAAQLLPKDVPRP